MLLRGASRLALGAESSLQGEVWKLCLQATSLPWVQFFRQPCITLMVKQCDKRLRRREEKKLKAMEKQDHPPDPPEEQPNTKSISAHAAATSSAAVVVMDVEELDMSFLDDMDHKKMLARMCHRHLL